MRFTILSLIVCPLAVLSLPWDGPEPTAVRRDEQQVGIENWPAPTTAPRGLFDDYLPWKRQGSVAYSTTNGSVYTSYSYATCGYISGSTSNALTCYSKSASCVVDGVNSVFGCCKTPSACQMATSCIPQTALASCLGASGCLEDPYITKCDASYPYCNKYVLNDHIGLVNLLYCDTAPTIMSLDIQATDGLMRIATYVNVTMPVTAVAGTTTDTTTTTSRPTISTTRPITTSPSTPTPTPTPEPSKKTPIGPIVGGVVGGIAVIGALIFLAWFLIRRNKNKPAPPPAAGTTEVAYSPNNPQSPGYNTAPPYAVPAEKQVYVATSQSPPPMQQQQQYQQPPIVAPTPVQSPYQAQQQQQQYQPPQQHTQEIAGNAIYPIQQAQAPAPPVSPVQHQAYSPPQQQYSPPMQQQGQFPPQELQHDEYRGSVVPQYSPTGMSSGGAVPMTAAVPMQAAGGQQQQQQNWGQGGRQGHDAPEVTGYQAYRG